MVKLLVLWVIFFPDIEALGHEDFDVRERAEARLTRYGDLTCPLLKGRKFTDPEKTRRARRIVGRTLSQDHAPLAFLSGQPLTEWSLPENIYGYVGERPGVGYSLAWTHPDPRATLARVVHFYGERARTQSVWKDWHMDGDGRAATALLTNDLFYLGVPPCLIRIFESWLRGREKLASRLPEEMNLPRVVSE